MLARLLIIHREGAPHSWYATAGEVRERIAKFEPEDADLLQVWAVTHDRDPAVEVTGDFAADLLRLKRRPLLIPDFLKLARAM